MGKKLLIPVEGVRKIYNTLLKNHLTDEEVVFLVSHTPALIKNGNRSIAHSVIARSIPEITKMIHRNPNSARAKMYGQMAYLAGIAYLDLKTAGVSVDQRKKEVLALDPFMKRSAKFQELKEKLFRPKKCIRKPILEAVDVPHIAKYHPSGYSARYYE